MKAKKKKDWNKVFCVGTQRTGTSSFARYLASTGLNVNGFNKYGIVEYARYGTIEILKRYIDRVDAAQDAPTFLVFKKLDEAFPNSKFVLTTRKSSEDFLRSKIYQLLRGKSPKVRWNTMVNNIHIYGVPNPLYNQKYFRKFYEFHNNSVRDYFKDREEDFIEICVDTEQEPWKKLADFLDIEYNPDKQETENLDKSSYEKYDELVKFAVEHPLNMFWDYPMTECPHNLRWNYYEGINFRNSNLRKTESSY